MAKIGLYGRAEIVVEMSLIFTDFWRGVSLAFENGKRWSLCQTTAFVKLLSFPPTTHKHLKLTF